MKDPKREGERWLKQAEYDLEAALTIHKDGLWWVACFQSQQAAEKAVKAFLYAGGERIVLGHSVRELVEQAESRNRSFRDLETVASRLDRFYIPTRYPNGLPGGVPAQSFSKSDAEEALEAAKVVIEFVKKAV